MALESFYGGKPGYSPIIKSTFKYISEDDTRYQNLTNDQKTAALLNHEVMNSCFQDPTYTDVWYGELCIIASDSMYDSNNGKIFRRTLKKQSSEDELYSNLYAEYLGQIVGMPGGLPKVVFTKIDDIKTKAKTATNDIWYPTGIETESNFIQTSNQPITDPSSTYPYVFKKSEGIELVPGMQKDSNDNITYNDNFEYTWLQVLNPQTNSNNSESDGTAATIDIGVKIPYLTIEPEAKSVSYTNGTNASIKETNTDIDGIPHPFYRKYTFSIPDGVRGIGIRNLRIETKDSLGITGPNNIVLDPSQDIFNYDENNREITIVKKYYNFDTTKYGENSPFWVYDLIVPKRSDLTLNPTSYICYAGDYNEVANVELSNDGTLTFNRNYGDPISTTSKLKWITGVEVDTDIKSINSETGTEIDNANYGKFTISYNEGYDSQNYTLPLVKKVIVSPNIDSNGETINVDLATSGDRAKRLTLQKEVVSTDNNNNSVSYTDYILKYPTKVNVRSADPDKNENNNFFYLTATYNDTTVEDLGKVGLTNVKHLGYTLGIKELDSTLYFPDMEENLIPDSPILIKEEINFNTALDFPSFSASN